MRVAIDYISPWVSVCCAVPILGFLEPLVEARCSTTGPKVSSIAEACTLQLVAHLGTFVELLVAPERFFSLRRPHGPGLRPGT